MTPVLRSASWFGALGIIGGTLLSIASTGLIRSRLYGIQPLDVSTFAGAEMLLAVIGLVAVLVPAWRARRVDPVLALRRE
jgi:ABC-type antimicrobial peptide transport system permease subunit